MKTQKCLSHFIFLLLPMLCGIAKTSIPGEIKVIQGLKAKVDFKPDSNTSGFPAIGDEVSFFKIKYNQKLGAGTGKIIEVDSKFAWVKLKDNRPRPGMQADIAATGSKPTPPDSTNSYSPAPPSTENETETVEPKSNTESDSKKLMEFLEKSITDEINELESRAQQGDSEAQYRYARKLMDFYPYDDQKIMEALDWLIKSANQGHVRAQTRLGDTYYNKRYIPQDFTQMVKWYQKAANQGHSGSQFAMGRSYYHGDGVQQNYQKSAEWFKKAAAQGHIDAMDYLANQYYFGHGLEQNYRKSYEWAKQPAEAGSWDAQKIMAQLLYQGGNGQVTIDRTQAVYWLKKVLAEKDDSYCLYALGWCYARGKGIEKDAAKAVEYYKRSAKLGFEPAKKALKKRGITY